MPKPDHKIIVRRGVPIEVHKDIIKYTKKMAKRRALERAARALAASKGEK